MLLNNGIILGGGGEYDEELKLLNLSLQTWGRQDSHNLGIAESAPLAKIIVQRKE